MKHQPHRKPRSPVDVRGTLLWDESPVYCENCGSTRASVLAVAQEQGIQDPVCCWIFVPQKHEAPGKSRPGGR